MRILGKFVLVLFALLFVALPASAQGYDPSWQSDQLWLYEAQSIYYANLERVNAGRSPLRWNQQLTHAARWFSWDSIENQPVGYCGHTDSNGGAPWDRGPIFGYQGWTGGEIAFCGFVLPANAVEGWMNSPDHRDIMLMSDWREIGAGYYGSAATRGYVTQDFGFDNAYSPVIINNEMPSTTNPNVELYIYGSPVGGWGGFGEPQEMQISGDACFAGAEWQPFQRQVNWTLESAGQGWKPVYVRTRDALHRTRVVSDVIYYGNPPASAMSEPEQMSTTSSDVTLLGLDGGGLPLMQFSLGWQADDSADTFDLNWGEGDWVNDTSAWGGTAFKMTSGGTGAWVWTTDFPQDVPLVAYARLKVDNNASGNDLVSVSFNGDESRTLNGHDFSQAGVYQEFAIPFTFSSDEDFLIINFSSHTSTPVYVDTVTFFSQPVPVEETYTWLVPGGNYRGQGVWVRYVDESLETFSQIDEGAQHEPRLAAQPNMMRLVAMQGRGPYTWFIKVMQVCSTATWSENSDAGWFDLSRQGDYIYLQADPDALGLGVHHATITITSEDGDIAPLQIPVELEVIGSRVQYSFPFTYLTP